MTLYENVMNLGRVTSARDAESAEPFVKILVWGPRVSPSAAREDGAAWQRWDTDGGSADR